MDSTPSFSFGIFWRPDIAHHTRPKFPPPALAYCDGRHTDPAALGDGVTGLLAGFSALMTPSSLSGGSSVDMLRAGVGAFFKRLPPPEFARPPVDSESALDYIGYARRWGSALEHTAAFYESATDACRAFKLENI